MDNTSEKQPTQVPIPALVSVCLALLGAIAPNLPYLESSRPSTAAKTASYWQDIEDVDARLWQDPFAAVEAHPNSSLPDLQSVQTPCSIGLTHHQFSALTECIINHIEQNPATRLRILGVMVSGGPYAEDTEFRMRTRYAVLSGLSVAHYYPEDAKHIGYFDNPQDNFEEKLKTLPAKIPFEWFIHDRDKHNDPSAPTVLLLWLDETAFENTPLTTSSQLEELFKTRLKENYKNLDFRFIGPSGSDTLRALSKEIDGDILTEELKDLLGKFVNAAATTNFTGKDNHLPLRATLMDSALAKGIIEELKLRGIDPNTNCKNAPDPLACLKTIKDHIVLISEWDTFYGRQGLPNAMEEMLGLTPRKQCEDIARKIRPSQDERYSEYMAGCKKFQEEWIKKFSYMRGLDGLIPTPAKNPDKTDKLKEESNLNNKKPTVERAEGPSQKDYLRRLGEQISELNQSLLHDGKGEIRAIGVLGSDAYDKLLVLKALRAKFPGTVFFTTDLDTRLMHPDDFESTRNLIVASSFGLALATEFQASIPPFRDSYQTAYFLATQLSLCHREDGQGDDKLLCQDKIGPTLQDKIDNALEPVRIYELGLNKPYDLSEASHEASISFHPNPRRLHPGGMFWLMLAVIMAITGILGSYMNLWSFPSWPNVGTSAQDKNSVYGVALKIWNESLLYKIFLGFIAIFSITLIGLTLWEAFLGDKGEPFAWSGGVSVWPSEIIRLIAFVVGCIFIVLANLRLSKIKTTLEEQFFPDHRKSKRDISQKADFNFIVPWKVDQDTFDESIDNIKKINTWKVWQWYCEGISANKRDIWTVTAAVLFFLLGNLLLSEFGMPHVPFRGDASYYFDRVTVYSTSFIYIYLVMLVFYVTQFSVELIRLLAGKVSAWPDSTLAKYGILTSASADVKEGKFSSLSSLRSELTEKNLYSLDEQLDIHFISEHTKSVGKIVYCPFLVLALMVIARSRLFDDWNMTPGLAIVLILSGAISIISSWLLRRAAEQARQRILEQLGTLHRELGMHLGKAARAMENQTLRAIEEIRSNRKGAFMPFMQEPFVQALSLPLGGWGIQQLMQYLALGGF